MITARLANVLCRNGIHYGWVMVAITFVTMLATAAAMGMPGVLLVPLKREFGWSTAEISGAMALRLILFGLMGPFAAALMQRYGVRTTIIAALSLIVIGLSLTTRMTQLWHLWLSWGVLVGAGTGMTAIVLGATVASRWFHSRRGLVLGVLTASAATGQLVFLPFAAWLSEKMGWRLAVLPPIAACSCAALAMLLFGADNPASIALRPYGLPPDAVPVQPPHPVRRSGRPNADATGGGALRLAFTALGDATTTSMFWMLFFTFAVCGFTTSGLVQTHFIPLCLDQGIPEFESARILALMGVFDFIGTIASGWLSDRYDSRWLLFSYYAVRGAAFLLLTMSGFSTVGLGVFATFTGLGWIATVPPTIRLATRAFGVERAPLVFGWIFTAHQLGAAAAALGAGMSRDLLATYLPAFIAGGLLCLAAALAAVVTGTVTKGDPVQNRQLSLAHGYHDD
jgi:MFS family permease